MSERNGKICFYCTKCGDYTFNEDDYEYLNRKCYYCGSDIKEYDLKYFLSKYEANVFSDLKDNQRKEFLRLLYEDFIINKSEFDVNIFRDNATLSNLEIVFDKNKPLIKPKCPYCHSNDTHKISTAGRMISGGLLGFGSGKIGKSWHCSTCNSNF